MAASKQIVVTHMSPRLLVAIFESLRKTSDKFNIYRRPELFLSFIIPNPILI